MHVVKVRVVKVHVDGHIRDRREGDCRSFVLNQRHFRLHAHALDPSLTLTLHLTLHLQPSAWLPSRAETSSSAA